MKHKLSAREHTQLTIWLITKRSLTLPSTPASPQQNKDSLTITSKCWLQGQDNTKQEILRQKCSKKSHLKVAYSDLHSADSFQTRTKIRCLVRDNTLRISFKNHWLRKHKQQRPIEEIKYKRPALYKWNQNNRVKRKHNHTLHKNKLLSVTPPRITKIKFNMIIDQTQLLITYVKIVKWITQSSQL